MTSTHLSPRVRAYVERNVHVSLSHSEWDELITYTVFCNAAEEVNAAIDRAAAEAVERGLSLYRNRINPGE